MPFQVPGAAGAVSHLFQALLGGAPSNAVYSLNIGNANSVGVENFARAFGAQFTESNTSLATKVLGNIGITATTTNPVAYTTLLGALAEAYQAFPNDRGLVTLNLTDILSGRDGRLGNGLEANATYGAAAVEFNRLIGFRGSYSSNSSSTEFSSAPVPPPVITIQGVAIDGLVRNANVFQDLNNNGVADAGEPTTTTNAQGGYSLVSPVENARLIATGGVNIDNGLPNTLMLIGRTLAGSGSATELNLTPLTTLADRVATLLANGNPITRAILDQADRIVKAQLGLAGTESLQAINPVADAGPAALEILQRGLAVANLIYSAQASAAVDNNPGTNPATIQTALIDSIARELIRVAQSSPTGVVDLGSLANLSSFLGQALTTPAATTAALIAALTTANQQIDNSASGGAATQIQTNFLQQLQALAVAAPAPAPAPEPDPAPVPAPPPPPAPAANLAPVNTLPATFTTNEDTAVKLAGLSVADVDAGGGTLSVTLAVATGTLSATTGGGVTVTGTGTGTLGLSGTLANINTFLSTVASQPSYTPVANASGPVTLTMTTNDGGFTGTGGPMQDVDTRTITITAVNDAPTAMNLTQNLTIAEDAAATKLFTTAPTVADVDSTNVTATLVLSNALAGVLVGAGTGTTAGGATTYTITGTIASVNTALAAVTFDSADNFNGTASVGVTISDGATEGPQGTNPTGAVSITVNAVNDAPIYQAGSLTATAAGLVTFRVNDVDTGQTLAVQFGFLPPITTVTKLTPDSNSDSRFDITVVQQGVVSDSSVVVSDGSPSNSGNFASIGAGTNIGNMYAAPSPLTRQFVFYGFGGNDSITGAGLNDFLFGGVGNDTLNGLDGDDSLDGGDNDDTFNYTSAQFVELETVNGGNGNDTLNFTDATTVVDASFTNKTLLEAITLGNFTNSVTLGPIAAAATASLTVTGGTGIDTINASALGESVTINSGDGNDVLTGSSQNDTINLGNGDDRYNIVAGTANTLTAVSTANGLDTITSGFLVGTAGGNNNVDEIDFSAIAAVTKGTTTQFDTATATNTNLNNTANVIVFDDSTASLRFANAAALALANTNFSTDDGNVIVAYAATNNGDARIALVTLIGGDVTAAVDLLVLVGVDVDDLVATDFILA